MKQLGEKGGGMVKRWATKKKLQKTRL